MPEKARLKMSNEDRENNVWEKEKGAEPLVPDRVEGQDGHPLDTPSGHPMDTLKGQGGQGRDTQGGHPETPSRDRMDTSTDTPPVPADRVGTPPLDTPLTGKTRTRWKEAYREVFGEVDELFEARVRRAMGLMEQGEARSRAKALEALRTWTPRDGQLPVHPMEAEHGVVTPDEGLLPPETDGKEEQGGKTAPPGLDDRTTSSSEENSPEESQNRTRKKWVEAYRTVFGEEPDGALAEARMRAAMNFYDPERSVGRRQALEAVRASEEEAAARTQEAEQVFASDEDEEPELLPLPQEDALTLGAALVKIGRLEAEVEQLRRTVVRLEGQLHRTETRLGGLSPGLKALRDSVRETREAVLKVSARVDTLTPGSSSEEKSLPPGKKELRELRARMDEERGRILLEVENRLEEAEELMRRATESRIAALESWVRRVSRYLGISKKGGLFGR